VNHVLLVLATNLLPAGPYSLGYGSAVAVRSFDHFAMTTELRGELCAGRYIDALPDDDGDIDIGAWRVHAELVLFVMAAWPTARWVKTDTTYTGRVVDSPERTHEAPLFVALSDGEVVAVAAPAVYA
jgi:hypothetical protein